MLLQLPDEIILKVLEHVDSDDYMNLVYSCKHISNLLVDDELWRGAFQRRYKLKPGIKTPRLESTWRRESFIRATVRLNAQVALNGNSDSILASAPVISEAGGCRVHYDTKKRSFYVVGKHGKGFIFTHTDSVIIQRKLDLTPYAPAKSIIYINCFDFGVVYGLKNGLVGLLSWAEKPFHRQFRERPRRYCFASGALFATALKGTSLVMCSSHGETQAWNISTGECYGTVAGPRLNPDTPALHVHDLAVFTDEKKIVVYGVYKLSPQSNALVSYFTTIDLLTMKVIMMDYAMPRISHISWNGIAGLLLDWTSAEVPMYAREGGLDAHGWRMEVMHSAPFRLVTYGPPGEMRCMATAFADGKLAIWWLGTVLEDTQQIDCCLEHIADDSVKIIELAMNRTVLAVGMSNLTLVFFDIMDGRCIGTLDVSSAPDRTGQKSNPPPLNSLLLKSKPSCILLHPVLAQGIMFNGLAVVFFDLSATEHAGELVNISGKLADLAVE